MKNQTLFLVAGASAAVAVGIARPVAAQTEAPAGSYNQSSAASGAAAPRSATTPGGSSASVRVASKEESKMTANNLAGKKVRAPDGAEVGTVKDFLIAPRSGEIRFAAVSTGSPSGETLRLVPFRQLRESGSGFTTVIPARNLSRLRQLTRRSSRTTASPLLCRGRKTRRALSCARQPSRVGT